jgi:hypothetical protein
MRNTISKYIIPVILVIASTFCIGGNCGGDEPPAPTCADATPMMENLFTNIDAEAAYYMWPMDLERHEYTFTSSVDGQICSLGYQSYAQTTPWAYDNSGVTYTIEIVGGPSITQTFSSTTPQYVSITPFEIVAGQTYTIRRTGGDGLDTSSGRSTRPTSFADVSFPLTRGNITFTASNYYDVVGDGGPVPSISIPQILFEFVEN